MEQRNKKGEGGLSAGFAAYAVFKGVGSRFASVASRSTVMNGAIAVGRKCELGQDFCECGQPREGGCTAESGQGTYAGPRASLVRSRSP
jgi:hypothetical protein